FRSVTGSTGQERGQEFCFAQKSFERLQKSGFPAGGTLARRGRHRRQGAGEISACDRVGQAFKGTGAGVSNRIPAPFLDQKRHPFSTPFAQRSAEPLLPLNRLRRGEKRQ